MRAQLPAGHLGADLSGCGRPGPRGASPLFSPGSSMLIVPIPADIASLLEDRAIAAAVPSIRLLAHVKDGGDPGAPARAAGQARRAVSCGADTGSTRRCPAAVGPGRVESHRLHRLALD